MEAKESEWAKSEWGAYLGDGDDLSLDLSDFVLSLHVVPELRLSEDSVLSEDSHSVELGLWFSLAGQTSSDHEKLSDLWEGISKATIKRTLDCIDSTPTPLTISLLSIMK